MELIEIVPGAFGSFTGNHQGLFESVKIVFKKFFHLFFITLQKFHKRILGLN